MTDSTEPRPADLGELTRLVRLAGLITDAALPLDQQADSLTAGPEDQLRDRSRIRGIAFAAVLRELNRYESVIRPADLGALLDGRVPEPGPYEQETRS